MKIKCNKCNNVAVWWYMPGDDMYYCDNHVSRGCSCQVISYGEEGSDRDLTEFTDEQGRLLPCVEFDYNENGYDEVTSERYMNEEANLELS